LRCADCGHDKLVALSCKGRGFCRSEIDLLRCPHCGGELKVIAAILDAAVIERVVDPLRLPARPPQRSPARAPMPHAA
jgi:hypothetical protein